ncbi:MAG: hypothetical protein LBJ00_18415 [Planctomycetaceae bacterium]|nr:hypothetical protein [Planctomycetaceae bacterium]
MSVLYKKNLAREKLYKFTEKSGRITDCNGYDRINDVLMANGQSVDTSIFDNLVSHVTCVRLQNITVGLKFSEAVCGFGINMEMETWRWLI